MPTSPTSRPTRSTPTSGAAAGAGTSRRQWWALAAILLVGGVLVGVALQRGDDDQTASPNEVQEPTAGAAQEPDGPASEVIGPEDPTVPDLARREAEDPTAVGAVDAPVVLVVYSDYQCPFCGLWSEQTRPALDPYVEAGDLRIEMRDITIFGPDSERAARAALAAGLQGAYDPMHRALFPEGEPRTARELSERGLTELAAELGLDVDRFGADLGSAEVAQAVQTDVDEAAALGVFSTPSFLLGERPIVGAQPTEVFVEAVEAALAEAG